LHEAGIIEYRERSGLSREALRDEVGQADVLLDQFRIGSYGVAAIEALALGKLVVSHVNERVRSLSEHRAGMKLPIIQATDETIETVVTGLARDRNSPDQQLLCEQGITYASKLHSGEASAEVLAQFLSSE